VDVGTSDREDTTRMNKFTINGQSYRLPNSLNRFQRDMYVHLINWKWKNITKDVGIDDGIEYDAFLPERYVDQFPMLYTEVVPAVKSHLLKFPFRIHTYFNHMASSQAANINLFLPILIHPKANAVLSKLNPQFARLANTELDNGYRIEYWDQPNGILNDKNARTGTDTDIAIAYFDHDERLCLWLIEHKLTEKEFTTCGGYKSDGKKAHHDCKRSFIDILNNMNLCYYHDVCQYRYWVITKVNRDFFVNHAKHTKCPFQGGMNQLWRNQLLAFGVEQDSRQPYKHVHFSVVKHSRNSLLDKTMSAYKDLIDNNPRFTDFTSAEIIAAAYSIGDANLDKWIEWYKELYKL